MTFLDRTAENPNRVKITYEDGGDIEYATVELADNPIEEGTPLNALNMNKLLNKEDNDYIVEQGTSGIWTYRKWKSGIAECWGVQVVTIPSVSKKWPNVVDGSEKIYYSNVFGGASYPFDFVSSPFVNFNFLENQNAGLIVVSYGFAPDPKTNAPVVFAYSHVLYENPINGQLHWNVRGRWKQGD